MGMGRSGLRPAVVRDGPTDRAVPPAGSNPFARHLETLGTLVGQSDREPVAVSGEVALRRHPDDARKQPLKDMGGSDIQRELPHFVVVPPDSHHAMPPAASRVGQSTILDVEEAPQITESGLRHVAVPEPDKRQAGMPLHIPPPFTVQTMDSAAPIPDAVTQTGLRSAA